MSEDRKEKQGFFGRLFRKGNRGEEEPAKGDRDRAGESAGGGTARAADRRGPLFPPRPEAGRPAEGAAPAPDQGELTGGTKEGARTAGATVGEEGGVPSPPGPLPGVLPRRVKEGEPPAAERIGGEEGPGLFGRLRHGLSRTRDGFVHRVDRALYGRREIDEETLDALEEALVTADLGVATSLRLIEEVRERVQRRELASPEALRGHLKEAIFGLLVDDQGHFDLGDERPRVVMVVGVNGVGKTTTIGKIAARFRERGRRVVLAAGDTFRAAAIEQLQIWGERVGAQVVRHQHGSDPAAVAFDAVEAARARGADLVLVDTAGRLHTQVNLMEELKKVRRVIGKALPGAPHEVLLVLDATTGQNALNQARMFQGAVGVDSIALTKLDGTARGGVIVGICGELEIPVKFVGIGEKVEDLRPFDARAFVEALF